MSTDTPPTETGGNLPPVEEASIYHLLKPEVLEHGDGRAVLRFTPEPIWTIGAGVVQGGIVSPLAWEEERRDLVADYQAAFGGLPKDRVRAVAIFTDNDQTQEPVVAHYGAARLFCSGPENPT